MKTQFETILVKDHDRWVRVILNRPDVKNALSENSKICTNFQNFYISNVRFGTPYYFVWISKFKIGTPKKAN